MSDPSPALPPAGIRLIRGARGKSCAAFAEFLNVSTTTIGNWKRGDQPPSDTNRAARADDPLPVKRLGRGQHTN
jgi:DNA-binding transcriptional regulator YiaG